MPLNIWERPRTTDTAISFTNVIAFILAARFLPLLGCSSFSIYPWDVRTKMHFGIRCVLIGPFLEITGRILLAQYYTIPKETVEAVLEDFEQLVDFFLIEFQRILFAENIVHTVVAFSAAFFLYWLIKILPLWAFTLLAVTVAYLGPLAAKAQKYIGRSRSASPRLQSPLRRNPAPQSPKDEPTSEASAPEIKSELIPAS
ncbi:hypothetical protein V8E54_008292 [Elaphomyces granulatus]